MKKTLKRIAIANRGEVAVRIIRACQDMGLETVLLHSEPDTSTIAYRLSDYQICIGPAPTNESYLNIANNVRGAQAMAAQAIHPGFGFLSENANFAKACDKAGLIFVGPTAQNIETLGDKIKAKTLAQELGIKTIPGYTEDKQDVATLISQCDLIGYPVLAKAAAGGGGRGLKVISSRAEAQEKIESSKREALSSFGSDKIFLEKYLDHAKHIEVQVFADCAGTVYTLGERECSVQRKHQKIVEEAQSPALQADQRNFVHGLAKKLATAAHYRSAGTVEFLFQDGEFYFIEMNTRLQVEHPVTELVLNIDLVKAQLLTAQEKPLGWQQQHLQAKGHSIECRIYAEDPFLGGLPNTGKVSYIEFPHGPGRRFDIGIEAEDEITPFYDSMIGKIIVWDETRPQAIKKLLRVLDDTIIFGVRTNIPFLKAIVSHPDFVSGTMTTQFINSYFPTGLKATPLTETQKAFVDWAYQQVGSVSLEKTGESLKTPWQTQWRLV